MKWLLLLLAFNAHAQYEGPAVEACRAYALKEARKDAGNAKVIFDRDRHLLIERYTRKVGTQFVSSVLTGNGAVVYEGAPSAELSFVCLLADDKRAVFFNWLPRQDTASLAQCTRDESLRGKPQPCLDLLRRAAEDELGQLYALRLTEATQLGEAALAAYRKSNDEWRQYRDAECRRRSGEAQQAACVVDLTRRRAWDMSQ